MREIKFRAWDDEAKAYFLDWDQVPRMYPVVGIDFQLREVEIKLPDNYEDRDTLNLDDCVLMQFTGLKDKQGKEICEGDIVRIGYKREVETGFVEFDAGSFLVNCNRPGKTVLGRGSKNYSEIIGNIYENLELLKQQSEGLAPERRPPSDYKNSRTKSWT